MNIDLFDEPAEPVIARVYDMYSIKINKKVFISLKNTKCSIQYCPSNVHTKKTTNLWPQQTTHLKLFHFFFGWPA